MKENILLRKKYAALIILQHDYKKGDYKSIQILHKCIDPYNKLIRQKRQGERFPFGYLETQIFEDILLVIVDGVCSDSNYNSLFIELYSDKFPEALRKLDKISELDNSDSIISLLNRTRDPEKAFLTFCLCDIQEENELLLFLDGITPEEKKPFQSIKDDFGRSICSLKFQGTDEFIIDSPAFNKFKKRLEEAVTDKLGAVSLEKAFDSITDEMIRLEKGGFFYPQRISPILKKYVITNHGGNSAWLFQVINALGKGKEYNYHPDVNILFREYCVAYVSVAGYNLSKKGENLNKIYLARELFPEDIDGVIETILDMYFMDCFYKMFEVSQEQIYKNFSWETFTGKSQNEILYDRIKKLQIENNRLKEANSDLSKQKFLLEKRINSNDNVVSIADFKEIKRLSLENERLKDVISSQKEQISSMEELLSIKEQNEEYTENIEIDMDFLQSKKYLFVGFIQDNMPDIKKFFPNSIFMSEATKDLTNIQVDAVVFLISFISHSMYYKVKKSSLFEKSIVINFNGRSFNKLLETLQKEMLNNNA